MSGQAYNLNLATTYVPKWGAWEVAREIVCNAIDADPDGWQIETSGQDVLTVTTTTVPELAQLFVVGQGTKRPGGDTIGQFGEGVKMAALAASRMNPNGLTLRTPDSTITFEWRQVLGVETLHAIVTEEDNGGDFEAVINLPGVVPAYEGRICPGQSVGPTRRKDYEGMRVHLKGVYIATIRGSALWDWNLNDVETNRDRGMVSDWQVRWAIGEWLQSNMTLQQARAIISNPNSIEADALEYHHGTNHCQAMLRQAYEAIHGKAVLAVGGEADQIAARKGHTVAYVDSKVLRDALGAAGIQNTQNVAKQTYDLLPVTNQDQYRETIRKLQQLDQIVAAPPFSVRVFEVRDDNLLGYADFQHDMVLWLSAQLFTPGNTAMLVRTYLHEVAHFTSSAFDGSVDFENGLDGIAARLAMHILGGEL